MTVPSGEMVLKQLNWRYAVKRFSAIGKIDPSTWEILEQSLILSPSSFGLQPWRFIVVTDPAIKAKLPNISWKQTQPDECSHVVVFAARVVMDKQYLDECVAQMESARGLAAGTMAAFRGMLTSTVESMESHFEWNCRQVYLALGQLMVAAAMLGIDTCPMEGIDPEAYDRLLGLTGSGYRTVVCCAVGYRDASDKYAQLPKVRFPAEKLIQRV